jgi:hypothetical protein
MIGFRTGSRTGRRSRRWLVVAALASTVAAASVGLSAAPRANAITCIGQAAWTAINASNSDVFAIAQNSQCQDMNAAYTYTYNDYIRGWYRDGGGTWHYGTRGYVYVTTCNCGWIVLLSSVVNGTPVRGQGLNHAQYVQYVT